MTISPVKALLTAEGTERKWELGTMELNINEKLDECVCHGMQSAGKTLYRGILRELDDDNRGGMPETWKNLGLKP